MAHSFLNLRFFKLQYTSNVMLMVKTLACDTNSLCLVRATGHTIWSSIYKESTSIWWEFLVQNCRYPHWRVTAHLEHRLILNLYSFCVLWYYNVSFLAWWCFFYFFIITTQIHGYRKQSCSITNLPSSKTPQVAPGTLSQRAVNSKLWKASAKWQLWTCSIFVLENGVGVCVCLICQSALGELAWRFCDFF